MLDLKKPSSIQDISVATILGELPDPVVFGEWIMKHREFIVVRVRTYEGVEGWAFTLTRDGAVAEQIRKTLAPVYIGTDLSDCEKTYAVAKRRSLASHSAGIGLRALSIVDLAVWDASARSVGLSIAHFLGGEAKPMPVTAIIGYPPGKIGPDEIRNQTIELIKQGWRRFKAPVAATPELSALRLRAVREVAPDAWLGCDAAWIYDDVNMAVDFVNSIEDLNLGWFEDVFPPGDAHKLRELRSRVKTPIAMGDEQGGIYYPQALIDNDAVDLVRIDLTCMGGITGGRKIIDECIHAGMAFAPHMFAHVHSQVFSALGHSYVPVEWGVPWTGVDPYADSLTQPVLLEGGLMAPLPQSDGFGRLVNLDWVATQKFDDPNNIFALQ